MILCEINRLYLVKFGKILALFRSGEPFMNKDKNLVAFPASKNYPVDDFSPDEEFREEVTGRFELIEDRLNLVRKQLDLIEITQERIKYYLDELENYLP